MKAVLCQSVGEEGGKNWADWKPVLNGLTYRPCASLEKGVRTMTECRPHFISWLTKLLCSWPKGGRFVTVMERLRLYCKATNSEKPQMKLIVLPQVPPICDATFASRFFSNRCKP